MQQEDDLRGLARVMDFMRAVSILFVGINVYWFCYSTLKEWGVTFEDRQDTVELPAHHRAVLVYLMDKTIFGGVPRPVVYRH